MCHTTPDQEKDFSTPPSPNLLLPLNSNEDLPILKRVEPALHQESPLDPKSSQEEVEADSSKAVALKEGHEEAKAHKNHHVHILESCMVGKETCSRPMPGGGGLGSVVLPEANFEKAQRDGN